MVSRTWRKVRGDWEAWRHRSLAEEDIARLGEDMGGVSDKLGRLPER